MINEMLLMWQIHVITVSKVRLAAVNKPVGVDFNVRRVGCILFFLYD